MFSLSRAQLDAVKILVHDNKDKSGKALHEMSERLGFFNQFKHGWLCLFDFVCFQRSWYGTRIGIEEFHQFPTIKVYVAFWTLALVQGATLSGRTLKKNRAIKVFDRWSSMIPIFVYVIPIIFPGTIN